MRISLLYRQCFRVLTDARFFHALYMMFTELVTARKSEGEVLIFRRGHQPVQLKESKSDVEIGMTFPSGLVAVPDPVEGRMSDKEPGGIQERGSVFHWR